VRDTIASPLTRFANSTSCGVGDSEHGESGYAIPELAADTSRFSMRSASSARRWSAIRSAASSLVRRPIAHPQRVAALV
jgi:hypothetical protein